jgi:alpha-methylacyl-CoA racemase
LAGIGPAPFAGMMLADHGATVIRVEREDRTPVIPAEHFTVASAGGRATPVC